MIISFSIGLLDPDTLPVDQTDEQPKLREKSYLERLEEKTIYENELNKLEDLLAGGKQLAGGAEDSEDDEYLKASNVYPAFNYKELNDQRSTDDELQNTDENSQINPADEMRNLNHYLTTMPTDLKNQLLSGPRLRRAWKKDPYLSYNPSIGAVFVVEEEQNGGQDEAYRRMQQQQQQLERERKDAEENSDREMNRRQTAFIEDNLNKEVDLEELTKYLMAKRNQVETKEKNFDSSSSSKSSASTNSSKDSDSSKEESKESKESKESSETGEANKEETLQPNGNYSTEFKKTITTEQGGQTIQKVESYKKSVHLTDKKDLLEKLLEDQNDLRFIGTPGKANYEKMLHQADLQGPIMIKQRKSLDGAFGDGHLKSRFYSFSDIYFIGIVVACSMVSILSVIGAGYCFYR